MNEERRAVLEAVKKKYEETGFALQNEFENYAVYRNKFSIHYVFYCGDLEEAKRNIDDFNETIVENDYLKSNYSTDLYWNFYSIFIVRAVDGSPFQKLKEIIENNIKMSRKFVLTTNDIHLLPPLFLARKEEQIEKDETLWEKEWRDAIGAKLYDQIMSRPKSHMEEVLRGHINDKIAKNR